jgi:hypothetical protein
MKHALFVLLLGCGGSGDKDFSGKPLEPKQVTIEGVTFTISIPKSLPTDSDEKPGVWNVTKFEGDHVPKVFTGITTMTHESIDRFIGWEVHNKEKMNLVRKETRPDGFAITDAPAGKKRIEATTFKRIGDEKAIDCTAVQVDDDELPSYDKTRAMLEKICDSIVVAK